MGTYATTTSLDTLMVGVSFDTATSDVASKCITWAEGEINKQLSKRYDISTFQTTVPPIITSLAEQLATGYLYEQLSRGSKESLGRAKQVIARAMDNLKLLADHKVGLVNTAGSLIARRSGAKGVLENTSDYMTTFAEDDPLNWAVDSDKLDDIDSDRD